LPRQLITAVLLPVAIAIPVAFVFFLLVSLCNYSWLQAVAISIIEPALYWVFLLIIDWLFPQLRFTNVDPREQLICDLVAFLAIAAVTLDPTRPIDEAQITPRWTDWRELIGLFPEIRKPPYARSEDSLPPALLIEPTMWYWRDYRQLRRAFADGISQAADRIERTLPKIAGRREPALRLWIHEISAQIAATLRSYAVDVILGGTERDHAITNKISTALLSASWGRWENLANKEKQPAIKRFIERFGLRLGVAAVLIAAAILVPIWFHHWLGAGSAQLRIGLLIAALLGLIDGPKSAVDRLTKLPFPGGDKATHD
jgi:hypothetical protein